MMNPFKLVWFWLLHRHMEESGHMAGWDVQSCTADSVQLGQLSATYHEHAFAEGDILAHVDSASSTDLCVGSCHVLFRQVTSVNGRSLDTKLATFEQVFPVGTYNASWATTPIESMLPTCGSGSHIAKQAVSKIGGLQYSIRRDQEKSHNNNNNVRGRRALKDEYCYDYFKKCTKFDKDGYCYYNNFKYDEDGYCYDYNGNKYDEDGKLYGAGSKDHGKETGKQDAKMDLYLVWEATKDFFLDLYCAFRGLDCHHDEDDDDDYKGSKSGSKDKNSFTEGGTTVTFESTSTGSTSTTTSYNQGGTAPSTFGSLFGSLTSVLSLIPGRGGAVRRHLDQTTESSQHQDHQDHRSLKGFKIFGNLFGAGEKIVTQAVENQGGAPGLLNTAGGVLQNQQMVDNRPAVGVTGAIMSTVGGLLQNTQEGGGGAQDRSAELDIMAAASSTINVNMVAEEKGSKSKSKEDDDDDDDKYKDDDDFFKDDDVATADDNGNGDIWDVFYAIYKYVDRLVCIFLGGGWCGAENDHPVDDDYTGPSKDKGGKVRHLMPEMMIPTSFFDKVWKQQAATSVSVLPTTLEDWLTVDDDGTCRYTTCEPRRHNNGACFEDETYLYDMNVCTQTIESWFEPANLDWSFENECFHHGYCYASSSFDKKTCDGHLYSSLQQVCPATTSGTMVLPANTALTMEDLQEHCPMTSVLLYLWMQQTQGVEAYETLQETQSLYVQNDPKCR